MAVKRKKLPKDGSEEDRISQLPESLIYEILSHLPTQDAVRTSALSTTWRNHWQCVLPALDLNSFAFQNPNNAFVSFTKRFINSYKESWIRKLRISIHPHYFDADYRVAVASWIDVAIIRGIHYLSCDYVATSSTNSVMPLSIYTCGTLVHLQLSSATLPNAEFVFLPCLKIMHLRKNRYPTEATLENLISGSPILEDLSIWGCMFLPLNSIQVRSQSLTKLHIDNVEVVVAAPRLQCLKANICLEKKFKILNLGFSTRLDIDLVPPFYAKLTRSSINDILTDISKVRDLVISRAILKDIFLYSKSRPLLQFCNLSRLDVELYHKNLPTILESCPLLESLILKLGKGSVHNKKNREPLEAMLSTVPTCLVSSLRFVEVKRLSKGYEGVMDIVRYLLKNSRNLEKLKLNVTLKKKTEGDFFKELLAMRRCSSACEVVV